MLEIFSNPISKFIYFCQESNFITESNKLQSANKLQEWQTLQKLWFIEKVILYRNDTTVVVLIHRFINWISI